ncbi:family 4 carbohydrate esterase [Favolaschia claudopus]|uniref:Family 4 carbohydrate esterase n=1 Tax=Favolaschia claudopus TaxID=2862362 RepID=A0AAW0BP89_9AGAR
MLSYFLLAFLTPLLALASDDGGITGPTTSSDAAGYSCDASNCKLPSCNCASTSPPGGLKPSDVPMFIVFTADDAVQSYALDSVNQFLAQRKNPNGCAPKMTYFTSLMYTNYTLVTDWFIAGNEIADHTMTHVGDPSVDEINGNAVALNALAGISQSSLQGFRAPFLEYSVNTLKRLYAAKFTYDSSATSSIPVTDPGTDAFWPYTLDYGMANDCLEVEGSCKGQPVLPGFWEIPMYAFFDNLGDTFTAHYNGLNRQLIGLYTHPFLSTCRRPTQAFVNASSKVTIGMINQFLDWAQATAQQNGVVDDIVSNEQLLAWVKNPVPVSQLDANGLLSHCTFPDFSFSTWYGCPEVEPTLSNQNPAQQVPDDEQPRRFRCEYSISRPIGPAGANFTGPAYVPFSAGVSQFPSGLSHLILHASLAVGLLFGIVKFSKHF